MSKRLFYLCGGLVLTITLAGAFFSQASAATVPNPSPPATKGGDPSANLGRHFAITGSPGIRMMPNVGTSIGKADVVRYVQLSGIPDLLNGSSLSAVASAEVLTSKQIGILLDGESTGFADTTPLWFVSLQGTFIFHGPSLSPKRTYQKAYEVFDPITGNLLMYGSLS